MCVVVAVESPTEDALLNDAARALARFDPISALKFVALRSDAAGLALRGTALAQLGDFTSAQKLLRRAAREFGDAQPLEKARCVTSEAEVSLASRDRLGAPAELESAVRVLEEHGDHVNALFARLLLVRRLLLLGEVDEADRALAELELGRAAPPLVVFAELVRADVASRSIRASDAKKALARARVSAYKSGSTALIAEVEAAERTFASPVARLRAAGAERLLRLSDVESILARARVAGTLVVDACRREVRAGSVAVSLVSRPVLLALAQTLAEATPNDAPREALLRTAFGARVPNDSMRARLRVEIGRLRRALASLATIDATQRGFVLTPRATARGGDVLLLLPPVAGEASEVLALLATGEAWSTSTLAAALGSSQRTVQRALGRLEEEGRVQALGRGRSRRWVTALTTDFATTLLLVPRAAPA